MDMYDVVGFGVFILFYFFSKRLCNQDEHILTLGSC